MYQQFFNFNTAPFSIAPDPHFIYMSEHHQEGLAHLLYGINQGGGFVALTGEVGTGKTTLCHCLLEQLPENIDIALVLNPKLDALQLLATICDELDIAYDNKQPTLKDLVDNLNKHLLATHAQGRRTVLLIDEAQNLSLDVLEHIRLLTNLETSKAKLLQIILVGQPELQRVLERTELRQLNQRITARYHLAPLSYNDTKKYIKHRLAVCGGQINIFGYQSIRCIYNLSEGIPRLINILCDRALLGAYVNNSHTVSTKIINKAAKEVFNRQNTPLVLFAKIAVTGMLTLFLLLILANFLLPKQTEKKVEKQHVIVSGDIKKPANKIVSNPPVIPAISLPKPLPLNFKSALKQQNTSLTRALPNLAKQWGITLAENTDCEQISQTAVRCFLGQSRWKQLIALNRPVIMEFTLAESEKRYALLLGLDKGKPVFFFKPETAFPVEQVLDIWDGYFLMLWKPPVQNYTTVYPGQSTDAVTWIKNQLAFNLNMASDKPYSNVFDSSLKTQVITFQQQQKLSPDGIVGPITFIHLLNKSTDNSSPKLKRDY